MRDFKFRAWVSIGDEPENQFSLMIDEVTIYDSGDIGMYMDDFCDEIAKQGYIFDGEEFVKKHDKSIFIDAMEFNVRTGEDWVWFEGNIMQYTGMKDKNGKHIYEYDIVELDFGVDGKSKMVVTFNDGCYWLDSIPLYVYCGDEEEGIPNPIVIGNTYENPDLIISEK